MPGLWKKLSRREKWTLVGVLTGIGALFAVFVFLGTLYEDPPWRTVAIVDAAHDIESCELRGEVSALVGRRDDLRRQAYRLDANVVLITGRGARFEGRVYRCAAASDTRALVK